MSYSVCLSICLCLRLSVYLSIYLSIYLSAYLPVCQTIYQAVWRTATCRCIKSILPAGVSKPFPSQIYAIPRDLTISRGEGCQSRVQIKPFCPRHPFISLPRVQIVGFCPRRLIHVCRSGLSAPVGFHGCCGRTAARARSAQGASQFAAGYAAVRLTHHSDDRPVHLTKTS